MLIFFFLYFLDTHSHQPRHTTVTLPRKDTRSGREGTFSFSNQLFFLCFYISKYSVNFSFFSPLFCFYESMLNLFLFVASVDRIAISVGCGDVGGVIVVVLPMEAIHVS